MYTTSISVKLDSGVSSNAINEDNKLSNSFFNVEP
jgi:hypothetical protein